MHSVQKVGLKDFSLIGQKAIMLIGRLQKEKLFSRGVDPLEDLGLSLSEFSAVEVTLGSQSVLKLLFDQHVLLF